MTQSSNLRKRILQHKPKNTKSKVDDKRIYDAMFAVQIYLERKFGGVPIDEIGTEIGENEEISVKIAKEKFPDSLVLGEPDSKVQYDKKTSFKSRGGNAQYKKDGYYIDFEKSINIGYMIESIKKAGLRTEFDTDYIDRRIIPDGGVLFLRKKSDPEYKKVLLISEVKRQGTNDQRLKEGKKKQATGNAIERLGKNLIGIKAMMNHEKITPFIVFGWGVDFSPTEKTVLSKLNTLNEFYPLNRTYIHKKDGDSNRSYFSPTSFYFRTEQWEVIEMYNLMVSIAESALQYYIF